MKYKIFTVIAFLGSTVAELFGGWDLSLIHIYIVMQNTNVLERSLCWQALICLQEKPSR